MHQEESTHRSIFEHLENVPPDPIFGLHSEYNADSRPDKVNFTVGYFSSTKGEYPAIFQAVKEATKELLETELTKDYLPISGDKGYVDACRDLVFGYQSSEEILGFGTVGGTAAIRLIAEFVYSQITHRVCFSDPTWPNHTQIFNRLGFEINYYPYNVEQEINFDNVLEHISQQPERTLILFQPTGHNPTGYDFSLSEWKALSQLCKDKKLIPFFDSAYQGFGMGLEEDVVPIRLFQEDGHEMFVAHTFSKSMGLYGERVGAAFVVLDSSDYQEKVQNHMKRITRTHYSNPPRYGEEVAKLVMTNPQRKKQWEEELCAMREQLHANRKNFAKAFSELANRDCSYIARGHGFFCRLGFSKEMVTQLREEFGVYTAGGARINLAALNEKNFAQLIKALEKVVQT